MVNLNHKYYLKGMFARGHGSAWHAEHPHVWDHVEIYDEGRFIGSALFPDMTAKLPAKGGDMMELTSAIEYCHDDLHKLLTNTIARSAMSTTAPSTAMRGNLVEPVTPHLDTPAAVTSTHVDGSSHLLTVPWTDLARNRPGQTMMGAVPSSKGLAGEQSTARALNTVKAERLFVIHSIPVRSNCDIDHVVICSRGIFIMDSKNVANGYRVDGDSTEYLGHDGWTSFDVQKDLMKHKDLIRQRLRDRGYGSVAGARGLITPAVVMWGGQAEKSTPDADDPTVEFVNGDMLASWIIDGVRHPAIISDSLVNALYNDMRRSTFWL